MVKPSEEIRVIEIGPEIDNNPIHLYQDQVAIEVHVMKGGVN